MSYTAIYRKYRPSTFDDVAGQQHVVTTLKNALLQNRLAHAYLFSGPSGNGKTSIAKLFAKAINCESETEVICDQCENCIDTKNNIHPDVVEIDAASNNGVDEIRSLIEKVKYAPLKGKYKIYIIDEVHMLSLGAFNALLKTLEEPPAHVVFILATTEPHKVIPTIISRCQRYDFTRVKEEDIANNIIKILNLENIEYEDEAVNLISQLADGGVRESLSILEQAIAFSGDYINLEDVRKIYGIVTLDEKIELINLILNKEMKEVLDTLNRIVDQGNNLERLTLDLINILKESVIYAYAQDESLLNLISQKEALMILQKESENNLLNMIDILMKLTNNRGTMSDFHAHLELSFIKMIDIASKKLEDNSYKVTELRNDFSNQIQIKVEDKTDVVNKAETKEHNDNKMSVENDLPVEDNIEPEIDVEEQEIVVEDNIVKEIKNLDDSYKNKLTEFNLEPKREQEKVKVVETSKRDIEENKNTLNEESLSNEELLSLLAHANKTRRLTMDAKWPTIVKYCNDVKHAKFAHQLKESQLIAVGDNYALVSVSNPIHSKNINNINNQIGLSLFISEALDEELRVFATHHENVGPLIEEFRLRAAKNTLPEPLTINIIKENKKNNKEESLEDKASALFGEAGFVIEE